MLRSNIIALLLFLLSAFVRCIYVLEYADLKSLGVACPERDSCVNYNPNMRFLNRNCECDLACSTYNDCCIDALRKSNMKTSVDNHMVCIPNVQRSYQGVYAIIRCDRNWNGSTEVRQKCEGPLNFRDPPAATPVTSVEQGVTYRNRFCAECNYANLPTLKSFLIKMSCNDVSSSLTEEQILADLKYNEHVGSWGVYRNNSFGNSTDFIACNVIFNVPTYLYKSVRFCRSHVVSSCPPEWTQSQVRKNCEDYMAVVYGRYFAYRNVHCAICNNVTADKVSCSPDVTSSRQKRTLDMFNTNNAEFNMLRCRSDQIYDHIREECRYYVCAMPNYVVRNHKCVPR